MKYAKHIPPRFCTEPGCFEKHLALGFCHRHYFQKRRREKAHTHTLHRRRILRLVLATPKWVDVEAILTIYEEAKLRRLGGEDVEVDHIVPLAGDGVCGLHVPWNLRIISREANQLKSADFGPNDDLI